MKSIKEYIKQLLEAGNKASSTRFFMLATLAISCILYLVVGFVLVFDVIYDGEITTSIDSLSGFVTAVSVNLGIAGLVKVFDSKKE